MDFSIHLKLPLPEFPTTTDWGPINATIAQSTERATWATAWATWAGVGVTSLAAIAAILSAVYAWKAVQSWRDQVIGEHEFGRLLDAVQALHDIDGEINNIRLQIKIKGDLDEKTKSNNFRKDIGEHYSRFLRQTVGLDLIWSTKSNYKELNEQLKKLIYKVAQASNFVFEEKKNVLPKHYAFVGDSQYNPDGLEAGERDVKAVNAEIKTVISNMRSFLEAKLRTYSKS